MLAFSSAFLFDFFVFEFSCFLFVKPGKHDFCCLLFFKVFLQDVPVFADAKGFQHGFTGSAMYFDLIVKDPGKGNELIDDIAGGAVVNNLRFYVYKDVFAGLCPENIL